MQDPDEARSEEQACGFCSEREHLRRLPVWLRIWCWLALFSNDLYCREHFSRQVIACLLWGLFEWGFAVLLLIAWLA